MTSNADLKIKHGRSTLYIRPGVPVRVFHYDGTEVTHAYSETERQSLLTKALERTS